MSGLDWSRIRDGREFEALVGALVVHLHADATPFGQAGPDGGVDTLHRSAQTVYQAKFRRTWTPSNFEAVARAELDAIRAYRVPGHAHHPLWRDVTRWVLVTNNPRGTANDARWRGIADAFAQVGIEAEWWSGDDVEARIVNQCPGLRLAFFEGHRRLFLTLAEKWPHLAEADPAPNPDWSRPPVGAERHRESFAAFLDDPDARFCVITGPGGVGKTRLLWQFGHDALGRGDRDVWWVEAERLAAHAEWYTHIIAERPALLLLDEPPPDVLAQLDLEAATRAPWKVVLTARSEHDRVMRWFDARRGKSGRRPTRLHLAPLESTQAIDAAAQIAGCAADEPLAHRIARVAQGYPMWMTIAARLRTGGADPPDPDALARAYVDTALEGIAPPGGERTQALEVLRRLALIQPVNIEAEADVAWLAEQSAAPSAPDAVGLIERLSDSELVLARGRLRSVQPDVVRDWLLRDWLVDAKRTGGRSAAGDRLTSTVFGSAFILPVLDRLLYNLSRFELSCRLRDPPIEVAFLDPVDALIVEFARTDAADQQLAALHRAEAMRVSRPRLVARVVRTLRQRATAETTVDRGFWGAQTLRRRDVLRALPEALLGAAGYVLEGRDQRLFLQEMIALVEIEVALEATAPLGGAPWPRGQRPSASLPRLVDPQTGWLSDFSEVAFAEATRRLPTLDGPTVASPAAIRILWSLLEPLTNVRFEVSEVHGEKWILTHGIRSEEDIFWRRRATLVDALWQITCHATTYPDNREHIWRFLDRLHRNVLENSAGVPALQALIGEDLARAAEAMEDSTPTARERVVARTLWQWHLQYQDDPPLRSLAERCEGMVWQHPTLAPFNDIVTAAWDEVDPVAQSVAERLAAMDAASIEAWFEDAFGLFGDAAGRWTPAVAYRLGARWNDHIFEAACRLVRESDPLPRLAGRIYWRRLAALRDGDNLAMARREIDAILSAAPSDAARRAVLVNLYTYSEATRDAVSTELGWFADWMSFFTGAPNALPLFLQIIGGLWAIDPSRFFQLAERAWAGIGQTHRGRTLEALFEAVGWTGPPPAPEALRRRAEWLRARLFEVPDMDRFFIGTHRRGELDHRAHRVLAPTLGQMSWLDLAARLEHRLQVARALAETSSDDAKTDDPTAENWRTLPRAFDLSLFVDRQTASSDAAEALLDVFCQPKVDATVTLAAPEHCGDLDPEGTWLPPVIAARIRAIAPDQPLAVIFWPARLAKGWTEGSPPWRLIAEAVCAWADLQEDEKARHGAWAELSGGISETLRGRDGLLRRYEGRVEAFEALRAAEADPLLRDYWDWRLRGARRGVEAESRRLEEERWT